MFVFGTCTVVWAQNHRHSTRTDSVEDSVIVEAGEATTELERVDWDDDLEDFIDKTVNDAVSQSYHHDRDGWLIRCADRVGGGAIFIVALSVFCVFFGPVILNEQSPKYGCVGNTPKRAWKWYPVLDEFKKALQIPVGFDTDVNAAALGEATRGITKGFKTSIYITVGTGIGAGATEKGVRG